MVPFSDHGLVNSELRGGVVGDQRVGASKKINIIISDNPEFTAGVRRRFEHLGKSVDACA